jgi:hypothetical protein
MSSSRAAAAMFDFVTASSCTRSWPTVLTIVASTSAVAAMLRMFSGLLTLAAPPDWPNAGEATAPRRPMPPMAAAAPCTSWRRVAADSPACSRSIAP